jgi:hypothetical protein
MLGFKRFFNARRVLSGVELVHKIIKGQFGLPDSFGSARKSGRYHDLTGTTGHPAAALWYSEGAFCL